MLRYIRFKPVNWRRNWPLHLMLLPGLAMLAVFQYVPMVGIVIAFQDFVPTRGFFGSEWVGLEHFEFMLSLPDTATIVMNTLIIAVMKIIMGLLVPVVFALLLNEIRHHLVKRTVQTMVYFPHFLSWVILGGILVDVLSMNGGAVNQILSWFGLGPYFFLGDPGLFRGVIVVTDVWKEFGFSAIIYLAALSGINPVLYEAAVMDGATRWRQVWHVTLPGIMPIVVLMATLSIGGILNAGFDQIFNLYSPLVYKTGDIIDTWVYRAGLLDMQYGLATAVGLFKSVVGLVLISVSYWAASRFANYRIF
ncbi:ABC transporter permease [Paenibacillus daejeonensis]|uniref:ABC transporter permease n=1 Tax=Paenibacillus daejeonensis TaxID=135193 RepID=UPI00036784BF|nr:ABC transporter permease subunit [Paenibacillus daejeonensis]